MKRLLATVLLAGASVTLVATAAHGGESATLVVSDARIEPGGRSVKASVTARGLPAGSGLDADSVTVTIDGRALPVTVDVTDSGITTAPRVLLVVDTSGSMAGKPMDDAKHAISEFVARAPSRVQLGLMEFSTAPRLLVRPTTDRSRVLGAVATLRPEGETALYDAVVRGVEALGRHGDRRLLVLSDGADTRSTTALSDALEAGKESGAVIDAVGFNTDGAVTRVLRQFASSGGGKMHSASTAGQLSAALESTTREYATALRVNVLLPKGLEGEHDLVVGVVTSAGPITASTPLAFEQTVSPPLATTWWATREALLIGPTALGASLFLVILALMGGGRDRRRLHATLERFTTTGAPAKADLRTASPVTRTALHVADRVVKSRNLEDGMTARLERAAVPLTAAEWLLLQAGLVFAFTLLLVVVKANLFVALLVGALLGVVVPRLVLNVRGGRRQRAFEERLPDTLQMTSASLSAGYSLAQALDGVVREGNEPMAGEIGRALAESRLGIPLEAALQNVGDRMHSRDFAWVVMAIRVQREVGGNLAGILTTVSGTMRERASLRRHVQALSAEGMLSAYILLGLPVCLAGYMLAVRRSYIEPLYTTGLGLTMIGAAALLMVVGTVVMKRIVKVEI